jgi:tRNA(Ile)-lysidine synthase TilS/MesJ
MMDVGEAFSWISYCLINSDDTVQQCAKCKLPWLSCWCTADIEYTVVRRSELLDWLIEFVEDTHA